MKMKSLITMSILTVALQITPIAFGQDADEPGKGGPRHHEERFANLSPDEREKLKAAHEKAMQDPVVQAAREKMRQADNEFHNALHASMLKADPSLQPILDRMPKGEPHEH
jgi:hypothetical protein